MRIIRLTPYLRAMRKMGFGDAEMQRVESDILAAPESHPVVRGLKGVRKARFARPGRGKSGGGRAIYFVSIGRGLLAMLTAYAKSEKEDLTPEDRRAILRIVESILHGDRR
jgi:hypothetical protein